MSTRIRWVRQKQFSFLFSRLSEGKIRRGDVAEEFDTSMQTASLIFSEFMDAYPDAMKYDQSRKAYVQGHKFLEHYSGATEAAASN
jgi:hypothetical protein